MDPKRGQLVEETGRHVWVNQIGVSVTDLLFSMFVLYKNVFLCFCKAQSSSSQAFVGCSPTNLDMLYSYIMNDLVNRCRSVCSLEGIRSNFLFFLVVA